MPPVIVGNVSLKTNLDHNRHQLYCEAFEYICESSLQGLQSALAKFARLAVGEVNKFGVSNRQHARCIPQVETFSKLAQAAGLDGSGAPDATSEFPKKRMRENTPLLTARVRA